MSTASGVAGGGLAAMGRRGRMLDSNALRLPSLAFAGAGRTSEGRRRCAGARLAARPSFEPRTPMLPKLLTSIFGSRNDRLLKQYRAVVTRINALEPTFEKASDAELRAKTDEFKARHAKGETLDDLLPEAFAVVREAGKRALKMRHFDVQLIGGMALHAGKIAEMRTGEGKTLV